MTEEKKSVNITVKVLFGILGIVAVMWPVFLGDIYNQYVKPFVFPPVKVELKGAGTLPCPVRYAVSIELAYSASLASAASSTCSP